jgi:copper chaperone
MNQHDTVLNVAGMSCGSCVRHITSALQTVPGVSKVNVQLRSGVVHVQHQEPASLDQLLDAVRDAGYEPSISNSRDG